MKQARKRSRARPRTKEASVGTRPRPKPQYLPLKLLAIRQALGASQTEMARLLEIDATRVSEYELGYREPNLMVLLHYARLARIWTDKLIDDLVVDLMFH